MRAISFGLGVFFAAMHATASLGYTDFGKGRPVAAQDLAGKKYCWSSGRWAFYGADGSFSNSVSRNRRWLVVEPGVLKVSGKRGWRYIQIEVLPDGRLHAYKYCLLCGDHDRDGWATLCN